MDNKYFYLSLRVQVGFRPKGRNLLNKMLPYHKCEFGPLCRKPATKRVFRQYNGASIKVCKTHAMWQCSEWNLFHFFGTRGISNYVKDATKAHAKCTRCLPK